MPTSNELFNTITAAASTADCSGSYSTSTTATFSSPVTTYTWTTDSFPIVSFSDKTEKLKEEIKEEVKKVDQHIDELEEDMLFFNETRENMAMRITTLENENIELKAQIKDAVNAINYLCSRVEILESKPLPF